MKKINFLPAFILISLFVSAAIRTTPALALMLEVGLEDVAKESDFVFRGKVMDIRSEWNAEKTRIYSYITLAVTGRIAGQNEARTITIKQPGGTVGNMTLAVSDCAIFKKGEDVVVFLKPEEVEEASKVQRVRGIRRLRRDAMTRLVGARQGKYAVDKDALTKKAMVTVGKGKFATRAGAIVTRTGERIPLEDFVGRIKRIKEAQK